MVEVPGGGRFEGETLLSYDTFFIIIYKRYKRYIYIYKGGDRGFLRNA